MAFNLSLNKKQKAPQRVPFGHQSPYSTRIGFWGVVTEVHSEDCTVHVLTDMGFEIQGVKVATPQWVTVVDGKHLTGERRLPPVDSYVFCLMPNGEYSSAFVLCSGYTRQEAVHGDFKVKDKNGETDRVDNCGWQFTSKYETGTKEIKNKVDSDPTIDIKIDQESEGEEKITITVHKNIFEITKDGVKVTSDKKIETKTKEETNITADKDLQFKSNKSGKLDIGNTVATLGALIEEFIDDVVGAQTVGSPAAHTISPATVAKLNALKAKWKQVFK